MGSRQEFLFLTDYVVFCRWLFILLSYLFWPLYCLSFFDLQLLFTPLVSSTFCLCPSGICNIFSRFRRFSLVAFKLFHFPIFGCLSLHYAGYSRNSFCALNEISKVFIQKPKHISSFLSVTDYFRITKMYDTSLGELTNSKICVYYLRIFHFESPLY